MSDDHRVDPREAFVDHPSQEDWNEYEEWLDSVDSEPLDMTDVEVDADTLASAGWGMDEDYGYYDGGYYDE